MKNEKTVKSDKTRLYFINFKADKNKVKEKVRVKLLADYEVHKGYQYKLVDCVIPKDELSDGVNQIRLSRPLDIEGKYTIAVTYPIS